MAIPNILTIVNSKISANIIYMTNKFLPGVRGVGAHTQSGMLHSILSPFPDEYQVLFTDFLDLNRIPKATITDTLFNIAQKLNFFEFNTATNTKTDTPLFNMGVNAANQLFIKTEAEDDSLGGGNAPAILIDSLGNVYINGIQISSSQSTGFLFEFDTSGITQYNRNTANLGPLFPYWTDPATGNTRFDNIFYGSPIGPTYAWNVKNIPGTTPSSQLIYNNSPIPGSSAPGFRTFASNADPLPVDCVVYGEFFNTTPPPNGALINNIPHTFSNTPITQDFTSGYTFTVGIFKQTYTGVLPTPVVNELVASQDIHVPFRGNYNGTAVSFCCNFAFEMTDNDIATGAPCSYIPFFNHNAIEVGPNTADLRWRDVTISFTTKANL